VSALLAWLTHREADQRGPFFYSAPLVCSTFVTCFKEVPSAAAGINPERFAGHVAFKLVLQLQWQKRAYLIPSWAGGKAPHIYQSVTRNPKHSRKLNLYSSLNVSAK